MANRPIFIVTNNNSFVQEEMIEFKFFNGFAQIQKLKSIQSLHDAAKELGYSNILEVSTKSSNKIGWELSAFNLTVNYDGKEISLESAFQGSKIFDNNQQYEDIYHKESMAAKKDPRLKNSGTIIGFCFNGTYWNNEPKTAFYDWLYINALYRKKKLVNELVKYDVFTDIEFNPKKSVNCQARSCAILVSLIRQNKIDTALSSKENFIKTIYKKTPKQAEFEFQ